MIKATEVEGRTVVITGGTGSFGANMAAYLLARGVGQIRIFSRDEAKQDAMRHQFGDSRISFHLGDTRDYASVVRSIRGSDLVFHAAALKQVPSAEFFPLEAVRTNIDGSANVLNASLESEVEAVVCLSTDKAVYPINAMGMSKALMEKTAMSFARNFPDARTRIVVTRYGNVMMSRGSVIPLFLKQIKSGSPVTVTDRTMTRFLMSLSESVDLVEYAFTQASSGDLLVKKAPACTIETLAEVLIEMFPGTKSQIQEIGFRHGEKLYESLLSSEEKAKAQDLGEYYKVPLDARDLNYGVFFEEGETRTAEVEAYTSHNTQRLDHGDVKKKLQGLIEADARFSQ